MRALAFVLVLFALSPAGADEPPPATRWVFAPEECSRLAVHVPNDDVTYRPGVEVDADDRQIVPPDLPGGSAVPAPRMVAIDITKLLGRRPFRQEAWIGRVIVGLDGQATINGIPLDDGELAALTRYCSSVAGSFPGPYRGR